MRAAEILAEYAAGLAFEDVPADALTRAKQCVADTVAASIFGATLPWSRIIAAQARRSGGTGRSAILGAPGDGVHAEGAALANGASAHAFELDSLRKPGAGVHPGATLVPPALALGQELGATGRQVLAAVVAGCEVLGRIGDATRHTAEKRGFHAPGLTGPLGAAVAAGHLLCLDAGRMANALGIAASLSGGLLEFAKSGEGGMVKRLHLGRAAESGIVAARLAHDGFTGPTTVLDGRYGFLAAFCTETEPERLVRGLGENWETLKICFKRYPCHITAHTPIEAVAALREREGFDAADVEAVRVAGTDKMAALHDIPAPADLIMAQYSIPWCVAASLVRDRFDPATFGESSLKDSAVTALAARIRVTGDAPAGLSSWGTVVTVRLCDGRELVETCDDFPGTPSMPASDAQLRRKFLSLVPGTEALYERIVRLEAEPDVRFIA